MSADPAPELAQLAPTPRLLNLALAEWHRHDPVTMSLLHAGGLRLRCRCGWTTDGGPGRVLTADHERHALGAVLVVVLADG